MKLKLYRLVFIAICCAGHVSSEGFCEKYWRDRAQILGCVGFTDTIRVNVTLDGVTELNLIKNNITVLTPQFLTNFTSMNKLFMTFNGIKLVEADCFSKFANATSINLSFNNIKDLPEMLFENNYNLLDLSLRRNAIETLKVGTFSKLLDLRTIDLSFNSIEHMPEDLFVNNANLEVINVRENRLRDLPEEIFFDLGELKEVDLSYNHIETLAPHVFKYNYKLAIIRIRGNQIKLLDYSVTHLNLQVFDLFKNPLLVENIDVKETLGALERSGVKMYLKVPSERRGHGHGHGHKKERVVAVPTYIKTILVVLMVVVTLLLVAISGIIVSFCSKIHKKTVSQHFTSADSQECLITEDNYLKLKIPNGVAVYVKNAHGEDGTSCVDDTSTTGEVCCRSANSSEVKSAIV